MIIGEAAFSQDPITCDDSDLTSDWTSLGPYHDDSYSNLGRVVSVWVSPDDPDYVLAGTRSSGIWRTTDGGDHWGNITSFQIPAVGITSIAVHNNNTTSTTDDFIYATTLFNGSEGNVYSLGLIYSDDGGSTWQYDYSMDSDPSLTSNPFVRTGDIGAANLIFKPSTYKLLIPNGHNIFMKDVVSGDWTIFKDIDDFSTDTNHGIKEIDFMPGNGDFIIISPISGVPDDFRYTTNGGTTWTTLAVPIPTIPTGGTLISMMCTTSIPNSTNFYSLFKFVVTGDFDADPLTDDVTIAQTFFYDYRILFGSIFFSNHDIAGLYATGNLYESLQLEVFADYADYAFVAKGQDKLYKAPIPSSGDITFYAVSKYFGTYTHADIRALTYYKNPTSSENYIFIGHDGGVSRCNQKDMLATGTGDENDNKWENINGYGFTITEFNDFSGTELDKNRIFTSSPDGNSYTYIDEDFVNYPSSNDYARALISTTNPSYGVTNGNGGYFDPATTYTVGLDAHTLTNIIFPKSSGVDDVEVEQNSLNWSDRPMDFNESGKFWMGTMDIFQYDDVLGFPTSYNAATTNSQFMTSPLLPTKTAITTLVRIDDYPELGQTAFYYSTKGIKQNDDENKLIFAKYEPTGATPYFSENRTPGATSDVSNETDFPSGENQIDHSWITDIAVNNKNPEELWICFGATRTSYELTILTENSIEKKGKVYFSDDGGETWENRSTGLPNYPIQCLEYWNGTDDIVFAGTDVGIFVWDKYAGSSGEWKCFNTGLPYCSVSDLEINNCTSMLRASTFGFGLWETPLPIISTKIEITSDITWTQSMDAYHDIDIHPGAHLTIENCEIRMPLNGKIIVENGGELIVDGGTITNYCDLWQGIEVWGKGNSVTHPTIGFVTSGAYPVDADDHGVVYIKNGGKIEKALTGITTFNSAEPTEDDYYGGIIVAHDAIFHNNAVSIDMKPFDSGVANADDDNISEFRHCSFIKDDELPCETICPADVFLTDVDGVNFFVCSYENTFANCIDVNYPVAIKSVNATYSVLGELCLGIGECDIEYSSFTGYYRGIWAANTAYRPLNIKVDGAEFINNERSILLSAVGSSQIWRNNFEIPDYESKTGYGLYLEGCINYHVEGNYFTKSVSLTSNSYYCSGIFVENNSEAATEIYRNSFEDLEIGIRCQGNNAHLQLRCNDFIDPIDDYNIIVTSGTLGNQGICSPAITMPAGNQFSFEGEAKSDFRIIPSISLNYRHHTESVYIPVDYNSSKITLQNCGVSGAEDCESTLPSGGAEERMMLEEAVEYQESINAELAKIDGGDTEGLIADIVSGSSPTTLKYTLNEASPYLSNATLVELVRHEPLNTTDVLEIMESNFPIADSVVNTLDQSNYEFSGSVIQDLNQDIVDDQLTISAMTDLLARVSVLETNRQLAVIESVNHFMKEMEFDSAFAVLASEPGDWARKSEIQIMTSINSQTDAATLLDGYISTDDVGADFKTLYSVIQSLDSSGRRMDELTTGEESIIQSIASKETPSGVAALNILHYINPEEIYLEIIDEIPAEEARISALTEISNNSFLVYPNPANGILFVELLENNLGNVKLFIYNVTGTEILTMEFKDGSNISWVNIEKFDSGIYLIKLVCNEKEIGVSKVIIE